MSFLLVDLLKYIHSGKYYISQANLTCLGIVVYIIALACHSGLKIVEENSKAVSENEAKNQFLANMSHEIRTPLNAVLGFNEMILRSTKDKNILEYAADIQSSGENMTGDTYYCKLPILALTANVMSGMYERYIEEGMQDFISKPINERELQDILCKWLPNDKVIFNYEKELETEQSAEENETDAWDIKIPGIDIASAKQYYTDKEAFEECLQDYLNSILEISEKIFRFRQN